MKYNALSPCLRRRPASEGAKASVVGTGITNRMLRPHGGDLGVRHALMVFVAPRALFNRVEDTGAYGWALVTLLGLVVLIGYAQVQTGLIDEVVEKQTQKQLEDLENTQLHLVDRMELKDRMEAIHKSAVFSKTITRLGVIVIRPVYLLASFMLIASIIYAMVALTGRKPEYHTLMSICVYAGFIELAAFVVQLAMMLYYRSTEVGTSLRDLAALAPEVRWLAPVLGGADPFRIWYWVLVAIGLAVTQQLSRRMAVVTCTLLCIVGIGVHVGMGFAGA